MTASSVGSYSLALAAVTAGAGILGAASSARLRLPAMLKAARGAIFVLAGLFTLACAALLSAILNDDFRLAYVVGYSERALPAGYKLAAFWAGQEGSLLLWGWMLAVASAIAAVTIRKRPATQQAAALAILAAACGFFAALMLFSANPFRLVDVVPMDGRGLNPMLQDPGMIAHPPTLFAGYTGFTVPFALCLAALIAGEAGDRWVASARRWVIGSWLFLTVGIVLGAQWAYVELGWGGYWAWDPVENASLLPWFTATGLLHSLIVQQRRGMLRTWNASLICVTFILCIFGTYLTRSGVIQSVHAFPESGVGRFFLAMLLLSVAGSIGVILWRRRLLRSKHRIERLFSYEGAFLIANVLLAVMMLTTMVGTIFPLLSAPLTGRPMTLGAPFYNTVVIPMALALLALMATGPLLAFVAQAGALGRKLAVPAAGAAAGLVAALVFGGLNGWMLLSAAIAGFALFALGADVVRTVRRQLGGGAEGGLLRGVGRLLRVHGRRFGGQLVHLGVVMALIGVAGSSLFTVKKAWDLKQGQSVTIGGYSLTFDLLKEIHGPNYVAGEARVSVTAADGERFVLSPQRRRYAKSEMNNSEVAIHSNLIEDLYLTLAGWRSHGQITTIEAIVNPLVNWIWIGGIAMTLGSLICLLPQRRGAAQTKADQPDAPAKADREPPAAAEVS